MIAVVTDPELKGWRFGGLGTGVILDDAYLAMAKVDVRVDFGMGGSTGVVQQLCGSLLSGVAFMTVLSGITPSFSVGREFLDLTFSEGATKRNFRAYTGGMTCGERFTCGKTLHPRTLPHEK